MSTVLTNDLFYRLPQDLMEVKMSNNARVMYSLMRNRANLSKINNWIDNIGVFIFYTREQLSQALGKSIPTIRKCVKELIELGLIKEKRQGQGKPNLIYVTFEPQQTEKNLSSKEKESFGLECKKVSANKKDIKKDLKLNNNEKLNNNDDIKSSNQKSNPITIIDNENISKFLQKWELVKNQPITLGKSETKAINNLISANGIEKVLSAVENISLSDYLLSNCTLYDFIKNFFKILNNKYVNKGKQPKNSQKTAENGSIGEHPTPTENKIDRGEFVAEITEKMLKIIKNKQEISNISYNTWFSSLVFNGYTKVVEIVTPNEMSREIIGSRYMPLISSVLRDNNVTLPITLTEI